MAQAVSERGSLGRVTRAVLLATVALVPLAMSPFTNDPLNVPKMAILAIGVAVAGCLRLYDGSERARWDPRAILVPIAAIGVVLAVAWLFADFRAYSLLGSYRRYAGVVPYLVVMTLAFLIADSFRARLSSLAWTLTISGTVVAVYGIVQAMGLDPLTWYSGRIADRGSASTIGNTNLAGAYLGMLVPVCVGLWNSTRSRSRALLLACSGLIVLALVLTRSQGGWAAGLAGAAVATGFLLASSWPQARSWGAAVAIAAAVLMAGYVGLGAIEPDNPLLGTQARLRGYWWQAAIEMTKESPVVGSGPAAYSVVGSSYRPATNALEAPAGFADDPHSIPLGFLSNAGLLGLAGLLVAWVSVLRKGWSLAREGEDGLLTAGFLGMFVAFAVQALISVDDVVPRMGAWVAIGAIFAGGPLLTRTSREKRRKNRLVTAAIGTVAAIAAVAFAAVFVVADVKVKTGLRAFARDDPGGARAALDQALELRDDFEVRRLYAYYLIGAAHRQGPSGAPLVEEARRQYGYLSEMPHLPSIVEYADGLFLWATVDVTAADEAVPIFERALALDPYNIPVRAQAADNLMLAGRAQEAVEILQPMAQPFLNSSYPVFWGTLALAHVQAGQEDLARSALEVVAALDPEEPHAVSAREQLEVRDQAEAGS